MKKTRELPVQDRLLKIGELAEQVGVAIGTVRYYETLGLIEPAHRAESGYRYYDAEAVRRLKFIRKAQTLQFTLAEIQQVLGLRHQGGSACPLVQDLLEQKIAHLEEQIFQMQNLKNSLEAYRTQWVDKPFDDPRNQQLCSLIEAVPCKNTLTYREHLNDADG
ncbi:heavy metal-responsive transcriptional regulator [Anthocerotibacter panamensis]|uniref:heavy metal-responsive transcriptional regulator n=1 Tax=Anthocerotibacter panamensis TaxID=2857077 RepID=UPI001C404394|nr:heavy metal-responsive transcriptional regulator [Anthocerotibacter panamensis]